MLKLNYTEFGLYMERTMTSLDTLMQQVVLAVRLAQPLHVKSGRASFLLAVDIPKLGKLEMALRQKYSGIVTVIPVDDEFTEVSLSGSWFAENAQAHEGMFLNVVSDRSEFFIYKLWQMSEAHISS